MALNRPNNVFNTIDGLEEKLDALENYVSELKTRNDDVFKNDYDDTFINFTWINAFSNPLLVNIKYNDAVPVDVRQELERYMELIRN